MLWYRMEVSRDGSDYHEKMSLVQIYDITNKFRLSDALLMFCKCQTSCFMFVEERRCIRRNEIA
jgi:hypothetical protein